MTDWRLLQTRELPGDAFCKTVANERQQHIWHVWNETERYCDYHHLGGLKAPAARVLVNRQDRIVVMRRTNGRGTATGGGEG